MKEKEELEVLILRVGDRYLKAPIRLRIAIGKVLTSDIKIKKSDEHN